MTQTSIIVTGGAGFIGANFVRQWIAHESATLINLDKLTYAGNPENLRPLKDSPAHVFAHGDIGNRELVRHLLERHGPRAIVHFAAESHVDRSVHGPTEFVQTNIVGTFALLEETRLWWEKHAPSKREEFRFVHVSTDEVFGSLGPNDPPFNESTPFAPNSPYAASKAAADHLVRAYHHTYGLPTLIVNCSNNYGPFQFPEKLIPLMILNAVDGKPLPVYGDGMYVRDWIHVEDHCEAIDAVLIGGKPGEVYNIGAENERPNLDVVHEILRHTGRDPSLIRYVPDRPGHDRRYAMNARKIREELGWKPRHGFERGLADTVTWYLQNQTWCQRVRSSAYRDYYERQYGARLRQQGGDAT